MHRMCHPFLIAAVCVLGLWSEHARALTLEDCRHNLSVVMGFDVSRVESLSRTNPITYEIVSSTLAVTYGIGPWNTGDCLQPASAVTNAMYAYFEERLRVLLEGDELDAFYHEARLILLLHAGGTAQNRVQTVITAELRTRYLELLRARLVMELMGSPWEAWGQLEFELTEWNEEWRTRLGADSVAASELGHGRVAVDPFALPPEELKVFLFHELAHLVNHDANEQGSVFENEAAAWRETVRYVEWMRQRRAIPSRIAALTQTISQVGLETWVRAVLASRGVQ